MSDSEALHAEADRLREIAHDAPLNKVFQDHTGHKFLGTHSMAWAVTSRAWMAAKDKLDAALSQANPPSTPPEGREQNT